MLSPLTIHAFRFIQVRHPFTLLFTVLMVTLAALIPASAGPTAAPAEAKSRPSDCGRQGQRPCKVWEFIPSCASGLNENFAAGLCLSRNRPRNCGREGQRPCRLNEFIPSCAGNLVEHFGKKKCIRKDGDIINIAKNTLRETGAFIDASMGTLVRCGVTDIMLRARRGNRDQVLRQLDQKPCVRELLRNADRLGYQTVTIGGAGGASFILGADGESGFAFDTKFRYPVSTYHTVGYKIGFTAGGGAAVTVGFWKGNNQPGSRGFGGDGHGATVGMAAYGGSGGGAWYGYDGKLTGVSGFFTAGAKFDAAYVRNTTRIVPIGYIFANTARPQPGSSATGPRPQNCVRIQIQNTRVGSKFTCSCDASQTSGRLIWGIGWYTSDSPACVAATHAGAIGPDGGVITMQHDAGRRFYDGSRRNGVSSQTYGKWGSTIKFLDRNGRMINRNWTGGRAVPLCPAKAAGWLRNGQTRSCTCTAAAARTGTVWGTTIYTDDSKICRAALHAGIMRLSGGVVTLTGLPGQSSYRGSDQSSVRSKPYGSWNGSYRFRR